MPKTKPKTKWEIYWFGKSKRNKQALEAWWFNSEGISAKEAGAPYKVTEPTIQKHSRELRKLGYNPVNPNASRHGVRKN